jgi:hypothetical protein
MSSYLDVASKIEGTFGYIESDLQNAFSEIQKARKKNKAGNHADALRAGLGAIESLQESAEIYRQLADSLVSGIRQDMALIEQRQISDMEKHLHSMYDHRRFY